MRYEIMTRSVHCTPAPTIWALWDRFYNFLPVASAVSISLKASFLLNIKSTISLCAFIAYFC